MKQGWRIILIFILCCHTLSILLFCKGFMLKRVVIPEYTECKREEPITNSERTPMNSCSSHPRPFRRVLWLLIDALRYDFMVYDETLDAPPPVYRNKMPYVRDILHIQPAHARLFKFIADPPTTTMQRLKALTTGSLPTFIDFGSNFNSYAILEDSLPHQASTNGRNVTFIGDDTWLGLYPDMFSRTFPYPSLNVKDLDTVDNGVMEHLGPEMSRKDAEIVIGHMLGVDHVGHTYGPSHWTMGQKLTQMNDFMKHVFTNFLDEDTVVFVLGDHGMSPTGDHGGETELETDAALLVYSPRPLFNPSQPSLGREVYQIDLVPTIAMVLGLPIPFSNLGMVIPEVILPFREETQNSEDISDGYSGRVSLEFLTALRINAEQIHNYLKIYIQYSGDFPSDEFVLLENDYLHALKLHQEVAHGERPSLQEDLTRVAEKYVAYMKKVRRMCYSVWAKFDNVPIMQGLGLLTLTVIMSPLILLDIDRAILSLYRSIFIGLKTGLIIAGISVLFTGISISLYEVLSLLIYILLVSLTSTIFIFVWKFRDVTVKYLVYLRHNLSYYFPWKVNCVQLLAVVVILLHAASLFSNSFILYEADMLAFFIQSLTFCFAMRALVKEASKWTVSRSVYSLLKSILPHLILMMCVRLSKVFYACRDLQLQDGCKSTTFILALASVTDSLGSLSKWRFTASVLVIFLIPVAFIAHLKGRKSHRYLNRYFVVAYEFGFPVCGVCVAMHWSIQTLPQSTLLSIPHWQHLISPWIVYTITIAIVSICVFFRPYKRHLTSSMMTSCEDPTNTNAPGGIQSDIQSGSDSSGIPRWRKPPQYHPDPREKQTSFADTTKELVTVIFAVLFTSLWIPVAMILNDGIALSAALTFIEVLFAVRLLQNSEKSVSLEACILWGLLSCHSFFGFGHQATVTSLRFDAAFVGIHGDITMYNLPLAGMLVGLNTLASQILFGLCFPLLLVLVKNRHSETISDLSDQLLPSVISYIIIHSLKLLVTTMAASLHRRHLMVWWVFTPRFLYESAFQVCTDISMILGISFVSRLENIITTSSLN